MAVEYITINNELTSVADAIRNKFSLSEELTFPDEYIDTINSVKSYDIKGYLEGTWSTFSNDSITTIPSYAFYSYSSLREVSFPNCTVINNYAFSSCSNLTTANFPNCSFVYTGAFYNCTSLNLVSIPKCVNIGITAFYSCSKLSTISCPNCITLLERAFIGCYSLTDVYMPLITVVNSSAFAQCSRLTSIDFPNCSSISYGGFGQCYSLSTASIPSCLHIGQNAFSSCYLLSHVYAPTCTDINAGAFMYCRNLVSLNLTSVSSVTTLIDNSVFYSTPIDGFSGSTTEYGKVYVPTSLYNSFISATNWTYYSDHIFPVGANLYSTSAVYLSTYLNMPSYMESFNTSSFSFANAYGSVFSTFSVDIYSRIRYGEYIVYDGYWYDEAHQEITFLTDSSNAYPPEFVKWFYSNQSTSGGGGDDGDALYDTIWVFNDVLNAPGFDGAYERYDVEFAYGTGYDDYEYCNALIIDMSGGYLTLYYLQEGGSVTAYTQSGAMGWLNDACKTIHIFLGDDIANENLISYLSDNAEQQI